MDTQYFEKYLTAIHDAQEQRFKSVEARLQEILSVINVYRAEAKEYQLEYERAFKEYRDESDKQNDDIDKRLRMLENDLVLVKNEFRIVKWFAGITGSTALIILIQSIAGKLV
jgi:ABC-type multidrug transport system fused ATPase/permease subunit